MSTSAAGIVELSLVFGSLLAFLVWELISLRRTQRRDAELRRKRDADSQQSPLK